jgi:hypothetical protein
MSIIPLPYASRPAPDLDARPMAFALDHMEPELWAPILPGESFEDALTRREAARDILDELLAEVAAEGDAR